VTADGARVARRAANQYQTLEIVALPRPVQPGLKLGMNASRTFVPGPGDPRELGVQINSLSCQPVARASSPDRAVVTAALTGGIFGALFAALGAGALAAVAGIAAIAVAQMSPLALGLAPYTVYQERALWAAVWIGLATLLVVKFLEWRAGRGLGAAARFVAAFSAGAAFLKLLALLHPDKSVIDALFHAHRLEYVLAGRYFFTQEMPGGVQFPYAIALYVFAAPWAAITRDHIALLRIVTSASEAVAGVLLCWAMLRTSGDGLAIAIAIVLFHAIPGSYEVMGNANLTNAFGQSAAIAAMSVGAVLATSNRAWPLAILLALLAAIGFLSHVSTFALLGGMLICLAVLYRWKGVDEVRRAALAVAVATCVAAFVAIGSYYARPEFIAAYKTTQNARAREIAAQPGTSSGESAEAPQLTGGAVPVRSFGARVVEGFGQALRSIGWPILLLAALGAWQVYTAADRGALKLWVTAWLIASGTLVLFGIVAPGGVGHQRQALEFIARAAYAGAPAFVVLGAIGFSRAWSSSRPLGLAAAALSFYAIADASRTWLGWIR
jgi:hypothetical protein